MMGLGDLARTRSAPVLPGSSPFGSSPFDPSPFDYEGLFADASEVRRLREDEYLRSLGPRSRKKKKSPYLFAPRELAALEAEDSRPNSAATTARPRTAASDASSRPLGRTSETRPRTGDAPVTKRRQKKLDEEAEEEAKRMELIKNGQDDEKPLSQAALVSLFEEARQLDKELRKREKKVALREREAVLLLVKARDVETTAVMAKFEAGKLMEEGRERIRKARREEKATHEYLNFKVLEQKRTAKAAEDRLQRERENDKELLRQMLTVSEPPPKEIVVKRSRRTPVKRLKRWVEDLRSHHEKHQVKEPKLSAADDLNIAKACEVLAVKQAHMCRLFDVGAIAVSFQTHHASRLVLYLFDLEMNLVGEVRLEAERVEETNLAQLGPFLNEGREFFACAVVIEAAEPETTLGALRYEWRDAECSLTGGPTLRCADAPSAYLIGALVKPAAYQQAVKWLQVSCGEPLEEPTVIGRLVTVALNLASVGVEPWRLVHVEHCSCCEKHATTTKHIPGSYEARFAELKDLLEPTFAATVCFDDKLPGAIGSFEVRVLCYGSAKPVLLYSKLGVGAFGKPREIADRLAALSPGQPVPVFHSRPKITPFPEAVKLSVIVTENKERAAPGLAVVLLRFRRGAAGSSRPWDPKKLDRELVGSLLDKQDVEKEEEEEEEKQKWPVVKTWTQKHAYSSVQAWGRADVERWLSENGCLADDARTIVVRNKLTSGSELLERFHSHEALSKMGVFSKPVRNKLLASLKEMTATDDPFIKRRRRRTSAATAVMDKPPVIKPLVPYYGGNGAWEIIAAPTSKTDADGRAHFIIDQPGCYLAVVHEQDSGCCSRAELVGMNDDFYEDEPRFLHLNLTPKLQTLRFSVQPPGKVRLELVARRRRLRYVAETNELGVLDWQLPADEYVCLATMRRFRSCATWTVPLPRALAARARRVDQSAIRLQHFARAQLARRRATAVQIQKSVRGRESRQFQRLRVEKTMRIQAGVRGSLQRKRLLSYYERRAVVQAENEQKAHARFLREKSLLEERLRLEEQDEAVAEALASLASETALLGLLTAVDEEGSTLRRRLRQVENEALADAEDEDDAAADADAEDEGEFGGNEADADADADADDDDEDEDEGGLDHEAAVYSVINYDEEDDEEQEIVDLEDDDDDEEEKDSKASFVFFD